MSTATGRLALLLTAEAEILQGQEVRQDLGDGRGHRLLKMADYAAVLAAIEKVQRQIASENANANGLGFALANLSGEC